MKRAGEENFAKSAASTLRHLALRAREDLERFGDDPETRLHSLRKTMKRYRSLLRLTRRVTERDERRKLAELVRALKNDMSGSRDALVAGRTLAAALGSGTSSRLKPSCEAASAQEVPDTLKNHADELVARTSGLDFVFLDRSVLKKEWKRTLRRLHRARKSAAEWGDSEDFHRWRKRAKDAWYQAEFLRGIFKSASRMAKPVEKLCDMLGKEHDLTVTLETVPGLGPDERRTLEECRSKLRDAALSSNL